MKTMQQDFDREISLLKEKFNQENSNLIKLNENQISELTQKYQKDLENTIIRLNNEFNQKVCVFTNNLPSF